MKKEITMSIHDFMKVQRNEIKYSDLKDSGSFLDNVPHLTPEQASKLVAITIIAGTISSYYLITPSETAQVFARDSSPEAQKELLKEGFDLLYKLTTETIKFGYKLFTAIL
jgi:hypothetical protein